MGVNDIRNQIARDSGALNRILFNNIVGFAYMGREFRAYRNQALTYKTGNVVKHITITDGSCVVLFARKYPVGLCVGSGDEIGWTTVTITPAMVGQRVAVFTSVERKTENDTMSDEQKNWFRRVKEAGGISEVYKETKSGIERMSEI